MLARKSPAVLLPRKPLPREYLTINTSILPTRTKGLDVPVLQVEAKDLFFLLSGTRTPAAVHIRIVQVSPKIRLPVGSH